MRTIEFELPIRIIAKKNSKQIIPMHGKYIVVSSKAYKAFEKDALEVITYFVLPKLGTTLKPPYKASYEIHMQGKQFADLDNMIASINDVMEKAGVIESDRHILEYEMPTRAIPNAPAWKAKVKVWGT